MPPDAVTDMTVMPPHNFTPRDRRRRGSIYAVVISMAILVSLIGLSAVAVGRINLRTAAAGADGANAELLAFSAIEHATTVVNTVSGWRSDRAHDVETPKIKLGDGSFTWKVLYADPALNNLPTPALQPVRIVGYGRAGDAVRRYSVQLLPKGPNLLVNGDMESGALGWDVPRGVCVIESHTDSPYSHKGTRYLWVKGRADRLAGPAQLVTSKVVSGRTYFVEAWMRRTLGSDDPWVCITVTKGGIDSPPVKFRGPTISDTAWTKVVGTLTPNWTGTADAVTFHIETNVDNRELLLDDVKLIEFLPNTPMAPDLTSWKQENETGQTF